MLTLLTVITALAVGFGAAVYARRRPFTYNGVQCEVSNLELTAVGMLVVLVTVLVTIVWGPAAARASVAHGYHQFLNGSVIEATTTGWDCTRDGPCTHEYRCDSYNHIHHHPAVTDSKGRVISPAYDENHTHYHACPYATHETSYFLKDNLPDGRTITIASHVFDANPREWRSGHGIPGDVLAGIPQRWDAARQRMAAGMSDPVTDVGNYTNFILPTEGELYKQYSPSIDKYLKAGLLPKHTARLGGNNMLTDYGMVATKFQAMKVSIDVEDWNARLMKLNAALGIGVQGDLHVVVVPASRVQNPDDYMNALVSYWQHKLGRWGFPKNGIAVVLGASSDGKTIEWARGKTGMPEGNGEMLAAINFELQHKPLDAETILGNVAADVSSDHKKVDYSDAATPDGLLGKIMLSDHPFRRACMNCKDKGDHGTGYTYLKDSLPVPASAKVTMFFIVLAISLAMWAAVLFLDPVGYCNGRRSTSYSRPRY